MNLILRLWIKYQVFSHQLSVIINISLHLFDLFFLACGKPFVDLRTSGIAFSRISESSSGSKTQILPTYRLSSCPLQEGVFFPARDCIRFYFVQRQPFTGILISQEHCTILRWLICRLVGPQLSMPSRSVQSCLWAPCRPPWKVWICDWRLRVGWFGFDLIIWYSIFDISD